jgi:hypothetical protein
MRVFDFADTMLGGWFLGDFIPTAAEFDKGEVAVKKYVKNYIETSYCHEEAYKIYVVLSGDISFNDKVLSPYSVVGFEKGECVSLKALTDACVMLVVCGDPKFIRGKCVSLGEMRKTYREHFDDVYKAPGRKIDSAEVSVVVQGAVDRYVTKYTLESIRRYLPDSTIIFSTWKGSDIRGLDFDEIVLSDDPGAGVSVLRRTKNKKYVNNTNRQLLSTRKGIEKSKTKYTLKLRSDMIVLNDNLLRSYCEFPRCGNEYRIFKEKIAISDLFTRRQFELQLEEEYIFMPFHVSDWFYFGLTEDLTTYMSSTPPMTEDEMAYPPERLSNQERIKIYDKYSWHWRYAPEQHYGISAIRNKYPEIVFRDWTDWNAENVSQSEKFLMNNFIILDFSHHGITMPKYEPIITANNGGYYAIPGLYRYKLYERYYNEIIVAGGEDFEWEYSIGRSPFTFE